jgi:ATP-dependent DNA helicase RecG
MQITLQTEIEKLPRVGPILTKRLLRLGLKNVNDLLFYFPFRYEDYSTIVAISTIKKDTSVTIRGRISIIANKRSFRRRMYMTECLISDSSGTIKAIWFNQPFITRLLKAGDEAYFSGKAEYSSYGLQLMNPSYEKVKKEQTHTARIVPVYSLTENLTEKQIRYLIKLILPLAKNIVEWIPEKILKKYGLIGIQQALREVHFPINKNTLIQARHRLKFNELFLVQCKTQSVRQKLRLEKAPPIIFNEALTKKFVAGLPWQLTASQKTAAWEILRDLNQTRPMNRLLEGDVGSGKTVVAALAMLNTQNNGCQAALMAPTEVLAVQHFQTISKLFKNYKISVGLLTRSEKKLNGQAVSQKEILKNISSGKINIIIGTHAIIQAKVIFYKLGLVIIDEQHRFGVDQRKTLKQKNIKSSVSGQMPHLLSMTATPIPRSLALTLYGDLDLSLITEMPKDRKKIITKIVPPEKRQLAYDFIRQEIKNQRQVFVICPLIDESDKLGVKAATLEYKKLQESVFPEYTVGLLHGRLKAAVKAKVMQEFSQNKVNVLVATAVVEVGVDVPNASVMMIEGAERFGLAQLHQFRGRVGRAEHQSYCFIFTDSDSDKTLKRLEALITSKNGFELAEKDLAFRGPGEIFGLRQSGFPEFKIAKLTDRLLIQQSKEAATALFATDPQLENYPQIREKLAKLDRDIHPE